MSGMLKLGRFALLGFVAILFATGCTPENGAGPTQGGAVELLNVSYDPTRELWKQLNEAFIAQYERDTGKKISIRQSHGGSSSQARQVVDGVEADVVTLAMWPDTNLLHKAGLLSDKWENRLPNGSLAYSSTIVFVVRKGNPRGIKDWPDLVKGDVQIITPSPKTSGNGKLSFLAAWGSITQRGGSEAEALAYVTELYKRAPVLDVAARGATTTFAQKGIGDVHLTWENEAHLEVKEAGGELEIVYPKVSVLAEPLITWVDANVKRKNTEAVAKAYLEFLYTVPGQEIIAKNFYRPTNLEVAEHYAAQFPKIDFFSVQKAFGNWDSAIAKFFAEGAVFDQIYSKPAN